MLKAIISNKQLIMSLAKNDFKTRFAGSILGVLWAFVQPVVTVLVYWIVFEKGFKSTIRATDGITVPFVLWLVAGIVPWFFFSEALNGGTNALVEYNYLVKKVVFKIEILPVVKMISAIFVHIFFVAFAILLFCIYGKFPGITVIQIIYYSFCLLVLLMGVIYCTSAVTVFFRDLGQIITVVLQVGIWVTPIMWNIRTFDLPAWAIFLLKLNPMYYICEGYRNAFIYKTWFWQDWQMTIYFWVLAILIYLFGTSVFKKLKVHFADVL